MNKENHFKEEYWWELIIWIEAMFI